MQSKTFSIIIKGLIVCVVIYIIIQLSSEASKVVPFPQDTFVASSTPVSTTTEPTAFRNHMFTATTTLPRTKVRTGKYTIDAGIASTDASREQGLSDRTSLDPGTGLLFVFGRPDVYGFWMKEMNFPIDIVWIDAKKKVVGVETSVTPQSFPKIYYPKIPVLYVLELNSMAAQKYGIAPGTQLVF